MKKTLLLAAFLALPGASAHALTISGASLSNYAINAETVGTQTGTTIQFTLDGAADATINIYRLANGTDNPGTLVTTLSANELPSGTTNIFWNGLWLINGENARYNGTYRFIISAATAATTAPDITLGTLLSITSVDIHTISILASSDANSAAAPPYTITYYLGKDSLVTARIRDSSGATVRTLAAGLAGSGENIDTSTATLTSNTLTWNGLGDDGHPVSNGIYTLVLDATDAATADRAITRTRTMALQSVASVGADAQKIFEDNTFIYPNPIRSGSATFQTQAVREGASITLKIYTIAGDLVREEHFDSIAAGNIVSFSWDVTNASGHKLGRGLYFCVVHEKDSQGDLQTVKKVAVIQ